MSNGRKVFNRSVVAFLLTAGTGLALLAAPSTAMAQIVYGAPVISERDLLRSLQRQGYRRMSSPVLNRSVFVLDALAPEGGPVRLIVSAYNGAIVDVHRQRGSGVRTYPDVGGPYVGWPDYQPYDYGHRRWHRRPHWDSDSEDYADRRYPRRRDDIDRRDWNRDFDEDTASDPPVEAPRVPERYTAAPIPEPITPRDPSLPAPTLKNPTVVKRSPTAIPKDETTPSIPSPRPPAVSTAPPPGAGTRDKPRVIEMAPKPPAAPTAPATPQTTAPAKPPVASARPPAAAKPAGPAAPPPPAVLDAPPRIPEPSTPTFPPATME